MADVSKKPSRETRSNASGQAAQKPAASPRASQRRLSKKRREEKRQRQVIIVTAVTLGLAALAVITGLVYDRLWLPSRPVAQVGDTVLTRGDYWQEQRYEYAREIAQNLQLLALFGGNAQFSGQFAGQAPALDRQVATIRSSPINEPVVEAWETNQLTFQGAQDLGIEVSQDEVNQAIAYELGNVFLPPETEPLTVTETATITEIQTPRAGDSATVEPDEAPTAEAATPTATDAPTATPTTTPTVTPGGPTLTPTVTDTPEPTLTPIPTPEAAEASENLPLIITELYNRYENELDQVDQNPHLSEEDFRIALEDQYRKQIYDEKIQEQLVPEDAFTPSTEPDRVSARQILLAVDVPADATDEERNEAFADLLSEAEALVEELRDGADFVEAVAERSDDPGSLEQAGSVGSFDQEGISDTGAIYDPAFVEAAFALDVDEISDPVRTQFGWHIIQVTDRQIIEDDVQLREARTEALNDWLEEQRTNSQIRRFPALTPTPDTPTTETAPTPTPIYLPGPPTPAPTPMVEPTPEIDLPEEPITD
ncbi:MAG: peptidylprolyl isomerase, partial [Chloroflexales bacterium]|nr:peptidylprolyl isomerase [Chloroflexales bacterium]